MSRNPPITGSCGSSLPFLDIAVVIAWSLSALFFVFVPIVNETPLRVVFGLPLILVLPGYVLIALLFPRSDDLSWIERFTLSIGLSLAITPLIGFFLNFSPWGFQLLPVLFSLAGLTLLLAILAALRRRSLPKEKQLALPTHELTSVVRQLSIDMNGSAPNRTLSILLLASLLVAGATTVAIIVVPKEEQPYTEFYLLDAEGTTKDYPVSFLPNTSQYVTIGIRNHENRDVSYTVEIALVNRTSNPAANSSSINRSLLLDRYTEKIPDNQTSERKVPYSVVEAGYNQLQILLFLENVPAESVKDQERIDASYRDLHLWFRLRPD